MSVAPLAINIFTPTIKRHRFGSNVKDDLIPSKAPFEKVSYPTVLFDKKRAKTSRTSGRINEDA